MGFDAYLVHDACACTNRLGIDGTDYDPELIHATSVANLNGEFCTAIDHRAALALLDGDAPNLNRMQGNE